MTLEDIKEGQTIYCKRTGKPYEVVMVGTHAIRCRSGFSADRNTFTETWEHPSAFSETTEPTWGMKEQLQESADKIGMDFQEAWQLHGFLCRSKEPGAPFAAELVKRAVDSYAEADRIMRLVASLAGGQT